jgi:ABC-type oligopeptide transport system substrate-binding subunit
MRSILTLILGLTLAAGLAGCSASDQAPETATDSSDSAQQSDQTVTGTGTISFVDVEGGFFAIQSDDGAKYDPTGSLDEDFQKDGLRVRFTLRPKEGVMTTRMWGTPVDVEEIERIEEE